MKRTAGDIMSANGHHSSSGVDNLGNMV